MRSIGTTELIGSSPSINELRTEIGRVARSDAKVLITGESGVGKEIVARAIGAASLRATAAFVPVNCAGIPETLLESELFGHVKGSFTGAFRDRPGKLQMASNGTIFLDEIGEMTLRMQGLLLRFLETGEIQRVGAERVAIAPNVRVIAATNKKLRELVTEGVFREDLFYRINVIHLVVPPLREHREDIPALVDHFMKGFVTGRPHAGGGSDNGNGHANETVVRGIAPETVVALASIRGPATSVSSRT
jgi:transcriptional regulator with GAF, ATPase, and Fis domain